MIENTSVGNYLYIEIPVDMVNAPCSTPISFGAIATDINTGHHILIS